MAAHASPGPPPGCGARAQAAAGRARRPNRKEGRCRRGARPRRSDKATATAASPARGLSPRARPTRHPAPGSSQFDGLAVDRDALGPHFFGLVAVGIALHRSHGARLEPFLGQAAVLHARRRRQHHVPCFARRLETNVPVRVLVAGLDDLAGKLEGFRRVVLAPAVMRRNRDRRGEENRKKDSFHTRCSTHDLTDCSATGSFAGSVPPACAISGRPPPLPPTCCATKLTSSPALSFAVRSAVTPAMSETLPSRTAPSTMAADFSRSFSLSIVSRSVFASAPSSVATKTLAPFTSTACDARSCPWPSASLERSLPSSFSRSFFSSTSVATAFSTEPGCVRSCRATCESSRSCLSIMASAVEIGRAHV